MIGHMTPADSALPFRVYRESDPDMRKGGTPGKGPARTSHNNQDEGITVTIRPDHLQLLLDSAITRGVIDASGIISEPTGLRFPWNDGVSPTVWQQRPDVPFINDDGDMVKYLFPKGSVIPLNKLRDTGQDRMVIAEGTKQSYAVLSHAPAEFAVYGMAGCWGWAKADLSVVQGRDLFLLLDADFAANPDVYASAEKLSKQAKLHGAKSVRFVSTTGTGKEGVDDTLAGFPEDRRAGMLKLWLSQASEKLGKRPAAKKASGDGSERFFGKLSGKLTLLASTAATELLERRPGAVTAEGAVALYENGVYRISPDTMLAEVGEMLGDYYTQTYENTVSRATKAALLRAGRKLPDRISDPLLNCPNTMVDLRTGECMPHDPDLFSTVQITVDYDATATAPVYEAWLREALRRPGATEDDVDLIIADLEETAGAMLNPSKTPSKALFLFGPSRSGKSTFLRLLKAVAGRTNTSAVTLHQLSDDKFACATLYGKSLNVAADLSSEDVKDLSAFKMLTGEDQVYANRKYGDTFDFTNQAMFAFSANALPTVNEASRAYIERVKPFNFPNSFAGHEDLTLETKLMAELPGILARWVRAYGRVLARGGYAVSDTATMNEFESKSDRVARFVQDMCVITPAQYGQSMMDDVCTTRKQIREKFNEWAEVNGGRPMGQAALNDRLSKIEGLIEVKNKARTRCLNIKVLSLDASDSWDTDTDEPVADPIEPSGVLDADVPRLDPWTDVVAPAVVIAPPVPDELLEDAQAAPVTFTLTASAAPAPGSEFWDGEPDPFGV